MIASFFSRGVSRSPLVLALLFLFLGSESYAEGKPTGARPSEAHRQANATAKSLAAQGDLDAAAQTLDALSAAPVDSAPRHFETAQRLTLVAGNLSRAGNAVAARATATRALAFLAAADHRTSDSDLKSAIQQQIGFLQERYLGDVESAKAAYRAAARLAPGSASAQEKVERAEQTEASARRAAEENR